MASNIWPRATEIMKEETCCCHFMGYSFILGATDLLYAPSHRQDSTFLGVCYSSCGVLTGGRNSSMDLYLVGWIR